jgi:hypothetical protein
MLDGDELMPLLARLHESHVEADFEFLRNHLWSTFLIGTAGESIPYGSQVSSMTHCSGCWCLRA